MPFTKDINDHYGITVRYDRKDRSGHHAVATIFRRDTQDDVGSDYFGEGRTLTAAEERAFSAARAAIPRLAPNDWRSDGG